MQLKTPATTLLIATGVLLGSYLAAVLYGRQRWAAGTKEMHADLEAGRVAIDPKAFRVQELDELPPPVKRYFQAVLQDGQPIITAARFEHKGRIDMGELVPNWKPFTSKQRVITRRAGFYWDARVRLLPGIPVFIHDAYVAGPAHLQASVLGLFNMAEMDDSADLKRGELIRFFAEAVWYPTALLPSQGVRWAAIDEHSAEGTLTDGDVALTMLFRFNAEGLIDTVTAESRGRLINGAMAYAPWQGRFWNYALRDGINVPLEGEAVWLLPEGIKTYFHGKITSVAFEFAQ